MSKFFEVELRWVAVVEAESEIDALCFAESDHHDICRDDDPEVDVIREITGLDGLPSGWDKKCLPYNGDGKSRLSDLLPEKAPKQGA